MNPLHHIHIRKRIHQNNEQYPHPDFWKRFFDRLVFVVGVLAPAMTFAQVWKIWNVKNAESSSIWTWTMYFIASIVWLVYGIMHREKPIVLSNILYIIGTGLVLVGIAIF